MLAFFRNEIINSVITFSMIIIAVYTSLSAILGQPIIDPLKEASFPSQGNDAKTVFTVFFLVVAAVVAAWASSICRLPTLFGPLLLGIVMRNVSSLNDVFFLPPYWDLILRKLAFVNIIVRWGLGINARFIAANPAFPAALGLTAVAEAFVLSISAWLLLGLSPRMAMLCG